MDKMVIGAGAGISVRACDFAYLRAN